MELGVCVPSNIGDVDYVVRAEELGYSHAWLADSQMIWSDCYATLALAADRTNRIQLGTGVAVSGTRPAPVTAASIATIHALAPGRTFLGVGAGNTAMRIMGRAPHRIADFDAYLETLRPLLRGKEARLPHPGGDRPIRHLMPDHGFVHFGDEIPLHVSGFGPRSLGLAGRHGDGAVVAMPPNATVMDAFWGMIQQGASDAERELDRASFHTTALTTVGLLDPNEAPDSDRVRHECGAFAMATVHYSYDNWRQFGHPPPKFLEDIWEDYCALLAQVPEDRLHLRVHEGHNCWVVPEEERFLTAEILSATCLIGTAEQIADRLTPIGAAGLDQLMLLPAWEPRYEVLERAAKQLGPLLS